jgi:protein O-GlcNAc transferase
VYLYATGKAPGPGDPYRQVISDSADHFVDISGLSAEAAARRIAADNIHILIDLNGFMRDCRVPVLAHRPAPVQVFWLGYGGGLGVSYVDYIIADQVVLPAAHESRYREKIVRVPGIYHPADRAEISDRPLSRESFGLRDGDFVFCAFNAPKKINCEVFDSWMRILDRVPDSCLWLSNPGQSTLLARNLREAARQRGIDPDRLVFSARIPDKSLHFARHRLADLFLDTFSYNASTTAIDALWSGLPILTRAGDSFCSRICADMLINVGLEDMITHSIPEFEQRAVDLSRDPARLAEIRARLQTNLEKSALFDVQQLVGHLETAYTRMWERCSSGLQPDHLEVRQDE